MYLRRQILDRLLLCSLAVCLLLLCIQAFLRARSFPSGSSPSPPPPRLQVRSSIPVRSLFRIKAGEEVDRSLGSGEAPTYQIQLRAGDFLRGRVEQRGVDVVLSLLDPS